MYHKKLTFIILAAFLLSACGGSPVTTQSPVTEPPLVTNVTSAPSTNAPPTPTPTPAAPVTAAPDTSTPTAAAPSPTPTPASCEDNASFVLDVTVPDNTVFTPGAAFTKVWRIKNTGYCTWSNQYTLVYKSGDQMGAPDTLPLSETKPNDTLDISVNMTAPTENRIFRGNFEIHSPSGATLAIDKSKLLWVIIKVVSTTAGAGSTGTPVPGGTGTPVANTTNIPGLLVSTCGYTTDASNVADTIAAINAYRAQSNLPPYTVNAQLTLAAQSHAEDMACNNLFYHPGSDGSTPASRVSAAGYAASFVSENVYGSYPPLTGQGVVTWWATDTTDLNHNKNLLSTQYVDIGVGYAFYNNYGYYVVDFAVP